MFWRWRQRRALAEADARALIARYGERAHQEARLRLREARRFEVIDANRPGCHWERVRRLIARAMPVDDIDTAPRFLDG